MADANDCPQNKSVSKRSHPADFHDSESILEAQSSNISETNATRPSDDSKISFDELQKNDESLTRIWEAGREGKHGIVVDRGVLFHIDHVLGERVMQLVVPATKRRQVLKQAHETVWSAHLGIKKTLQRIRYSFWWPDLKKDVQTFVNTCCECQLKARKMRSDEVPITPIQRPESPWEMVNMDCIGPIEPKSASGKRYVLSVIDYATRWPEAVPLSALTAKATCDALLQIFTRTGIPKIIISDCGTNFTSELTCLLEKQLGCCPRFSTPGYPQTNGLVERWNGVLKSMLKSFVVEHPRDWDKLLPFLLWAYREVLNTILGVAPFHFR